MQDYPVPEHLIPMATAVDWLDVAREPDITNRVPQTSHKQVIVEQTNVALGMV
jgi:hypothetical protein